MRFIQANRPTFFQRVTGFFVPTALNAVILTALPPVLMFDQHRLAPIKKPALLRGGFFREPFTGPESPVLDSHQRLSDVADNTVGNRQVVSSDANQVDYGGVRRQSNAGSINDGACFS